MLRDTLREAWTAMRYNRRRTALTMLGMAWGIATVVLLLAYGNGFGQAITNIFASFGTKTMILVPGRTSMQAGGQKAGVALRFTLDDIDLLTTNVPSSSAPLLLPGHNTSAVFGSWGSLAYPSSSYLLSLRSFRM